MPLNRCKPLLPKDAIGLALPQFAMVAAALVSSSVPPASVAMVHVVLPVTKKNFAVIPTRLVGFVRRSESVGYMGRIRSLFGNEHGILFLSTIQASRGVFHRLFFS